MPHAPKLPPGWAAALAPEFAKPYWSELQQFVTEQRAQHEVFPPADEVFSAFELTDLPDVRVLILGQDPYHDNGQAHGLSFSVKPGVSTPPSLANMYKELKADLGCKIPNNGYLVPWAKQGVMMLNAVLTVQAHTPNSHKDRGWETFTDAVIRTLSAREKPMVFVLWGAYAKKKKKLIDAAKHTVIEGAHPSPLSVKLFMGSRPFSQVNTALEGFGDRPIDWQIPNL